MEGWVNPVKTFGHKTLGVFYVNSKDRFYRQGTHLITFVYDNGSSEVKSPDAYFHQITSQRPLCPQVLCSRRRVISFYGVASPKCR